MKSCPKCGAVLAAPQPRPLPDSLPGIVGKVCDGCGWTRADTKRPRPVRLPKSRG